MDVLSYRNSVSERVRWWEDTLRRSARKYLTVLLGMSADLSADRFDYGHILDPETIKSMPVEERRALVLGVKSCVAFLVREAFEGDDSRLYEAMEQLDGIEERIRREFTRKG